MTHEAWQWPIMQKKDQFAIWSITAQTDFALIKGRNYSQLNSFGTGAKIETHFIKLMLCGFCFIDDSYNYHLLIGIYCPS